MAKNFINKRHKTGEDRPTFTPDGGSSVNLRWDTKKDQKQLRKERATGKLAAACHEINAASHQSKWDIKCERGPGVVYIDKKMIARITIDSADCHKIIPTTKLLAEVGLSIDELTRVFNKKTLE